MACLYFTALNQIDRQMKFKFSHFTPQVRLFFVEKRKPKIFGLRNGMKRGINKIFTFAIR